jgi:hypothetical protein
MIRRLVLVALLSTFAIDAVAKPAKAKDSTPPVITHVRIAEAPQGQAIVVRARIDDASEIFAPAVYVRSQGASEFVTIAMVRVRDGFEAVIPPEQVSGPLEYFIEAFDEEGNGPAREGTPEAPFAITMGGKAPPPPPIGSVVAPPPPPPEGGQITKPVEPKDEDGGLVTRWWFWTIIGVAVTGGIVATVLATRPGDPLDFVDIEVRGPDPTQGL